MTGYSGSEMVEFLSARLAEHEAWAGLAASQCGSAKWEPEEGTDTTVLSRVRIGHDRFFESLGEEGYASEHIAANDPAYVLADIKAKRQIIELHSAEPGQHPDFCGHDQHELPCPTLRLLTLPYASHPDYREDWRP